MRVLLLLFVSLAPLAAQTPPQPVVLSETVVISASAVVEEQEQTPVAVDVIRRAGIERREARDVADLLREIPGATVARTGSNGKSTTLFLRGGSSKQALVLWNGVELNNPYFSGYNLGQLSSAGVERVEVVRGPFSALYGSEAVSGVVHVITRPAGDHLSADLEAGERALLDAAATFSASGRRWGAQGTLERRQDDGFYANDWFASNLFQGGLHLHPWPAFNAALLARHSTYELGIPFAPNLEFSAFVPSPQRGEEGSETQVTLPLSFRRGEGLYELRLAQSDRHDLFADPERLESSDTDSQVRSVRALGQWRTGTFGTLSLGGEMEEATVDHAGFVIIDRRNRNSDSIFVEERLSFPLFQSSSLEVAAGLRHDRYDTFGGQTSPRLAAAWRSGPHKLRAGYGQAFRAPAIGELYSPFFGNASLEPERSRSFEAGYDFTTPRSSFSATFFDSEYEELIAFGPSFTFENIELAEVHGLELSFRHRAGPWQGGASYTHLRTENRQTGQELVRRPEHSGSAFLGLIAGAMDSMLVINHRGERLDVTDIAPFGVVRAEGSTTADLTLRYRVRAFLPYLKVENLTGEEYEEVYGYPSPGRRLSVGVRFAR